MRGGTSSLLGGFCLLTSLLSVFVSFCQQLHSIAMRNTVRAPSGALSREWDIGAGLRDPVTIAPPLDIPPIPDPQ
uniref:Uncharacterized protein n=1 Tax=Physcomitrium patens TaxID=3218 RepID=A0A2K1I9I0_PHYPA|nr:hypothetical protein PHYPA_031303 [Physcomitrium patens]